MSYSLRKKIVLNTFVFFCILCQNFTLKENICKKRQIQTKTKRKRTKTTNNCTFYIMLQYVNFVRRIFKICFHKRYHKRNFKWPSINTPVCPTHNSTVKNVVWSWMKEITMFFCFWKMIHFICGFSTKVTFAFLASATMEKLAELKGPFTCLGFFMVN